MTKNSERTIMGGLALPALVVGGIPETSLIDKSKLRSPLICGSVGRRQIAEACFYGTP